MKLNKTHPVVLIVGRTNVGKSTLFNRLAEEKKSIVFSRSGVTRDAISTTITWSDRTFSLIDTGGMSFSRQADEIQKKVQKTVVDLLDQGDIILFVCDGKSGLAYEDHEIARILHRTKKKIMLVINKADNTSIIEEKSFEFDRLGFDHTLRTSGIHGTGTGDLLAAIVENLPEKTDVQEVEDSRYKIVIIGKPNVGKSSLMNVLLQQERSIVSDVAGTTREAVSEIIKHNDHFITLVDTAGVRRKRSVNDDLEELMVKSSMDAIRTSDTVILMIDASEGTVSDQELKLLFYAYEEKKNLLVLFNKSDIMGEAQRESLKQCLVDYNFIFKKVPTLTISCMTKKNTEKILREVNALHLRAQQEFNSTDVNYKVQESLKNKPLYHNRLPLRLFKIRVIPGKAPTFVMHVNHPEWFDAAALGCIENILRETFNVKGVPLFFIMRKV